MPRRACGRRLFGIVAAGAFAMVSGSSFAADGPVRYLLHVSPGGATDVMARKLGNELQKMTGQPFVIENRPGGRGASQLSELKRAEPDGTTIGSVTNTHLAAFHQTLRSYNVDSFDWIAKLVSEPYVFVVRSDSPVKTMPDLVAAIKHASDKMVRGRLHPRLRQPYRVGDFHACGAPAEQQHQLGSL